MVKADMSRDYYADLELQPTADLIEIKKQFKKLALKWHPDRNPGKETEVNAKFQTIQSAHEVLSDEAERRRYDAGRRVRTSRYSSVFTTTTGATRSTPGNPYSNAGAQWQPPPKPFGTPRGAQRPSGAERYQSFTAGAAFRPANAKPQDQKTKQDNADAFERMKRQAPPRQPPPGSFARNAAPRTWQPKEPPMTPDPKYTPQSGREESNNQKHAPPPKSSRPGYAEWNEGGLHGRQSPKKSGFVPSNPGGDEPAAPTASSAYYNNRSNRASNVRESVAPEPPQPPPRPNAFEKYRESNEAMDGGTRQSTPYATQGGEKTNPFESANLNRSKTTRERSSKAREYATSGWDSEKAVPSSASRDKPRSASPPRSRNFDGNVSSSGTDSPPKRNHSHLYSSPPTARADTQARGTPRSSTRFQASAADDDTSSDGQDSGIGGTTNNHSSYRKLHKMKVPPQSGANALPRSNVADDQYRKPNLAEFRTMYSSGDPLLNRLRSESAGNQHGVNGTPQPMYEQGSFRRTSSYNFPSATNSFSAPFQHTTCPYLPKVLLTPEKLRGGTEQDRISKQKQGPFASNGGSSSAAENPSNSPYRQEYTTSTPSSPLSKADDLSNFEQMMMGGLHRALKHAANAKDMSMQDTARESDQANCQTFIFGQPTELRSSISGSSHVNRIPRSSADDDLGDKIACSRSPKRKIGVYDSNTDILSWSPRKLADFYAGLTNSQSNSTNPINDRFPSAYTSKPSANPPLFTASTVNTKFETGQWDGKFRATSMFDPPATETSRSQATNRNGRRSPIKSRSTGPTRSASASVHSDSQPTTSEQPSQPVFPESPISKPFSPDEWFGEEIFKPSTFAPPTPRASSRPPAFSRTPSRKGSRVKTSNVSKTNGGRATVEEGDSSDEEIVPLSARPTVHVNGLNGSAQTGPASPNAMDIDSPDEINRDTTTSAREARNVPAEPIRPEWRSSGPNGSIPPSKKGLHGDEDLAANLDELRNTEPIFAPVHGLNSVNDLKSSLPFQSSASATIPIKSEVRYSTKLQIPRPPLAPKVPSPVRDGRRMSPSSWQSYLVAFKAYLTDYKLYDEKIEAHFQARQAMDAGSNTGWAWLEPHSDILFDSKIAEVKQDADLREKWAAAAKDHVTALEEFRLAREAVKPRENE